jgi:hypothetical protein
MKTKTEVSVHSMDMAWVARATLSRIQLAMECLWPDNSARCGRSIMVTALIRQPK